MREHSEVETVEVPVLTEDQVAELRKAVDKYVGVFEDLQATADTISDIVDRAEVLSGDRGQDVPRAGAAGGGTRAVEDGQPRNRGRLPGRRAPAGATVAAVSDRAAQRSDPPQRRQPGRAAVQGAPPAEGLTGPQQRVLNAIAWWNAVGFERPTKQQVGFIANYRVGKKVGGTYGNVLGDLRSSGLIDYPAQSVVELTEEGRALAGSVAIAPTTEGIQAAAHARLAEPESRVLQVIIDAYPGDLSKKEAGEAAGYSVGDKVGGTYGNVLGRLRTLGFIDYPAPGRVVAAEVLFL
jgi:hypothetical protein